MSALRCAERAQHLAAYETQARQTACSWTLRARRVMAPTQSPLATSLALADSLYMTLSLSLSEQNTQRAEAN